MRALVKVKMEMGQCNLIARRIDGINGCTNDAKNIVHHERPFVFVRVALVTECMSMLKSWCLARMDGACTWSA